MSSEAFYRIDESHRADDEVCFFTHAPVGLESTCFRLAKGIPYEEPFPESVHLVMQDDEPGMLVPDVVGNTRGLLIVSEPLRQVIESHQRARTEYFRVAIVDHKGRTASNAHYIVNPIGSYDCADLEASTIEWFEGDVVDVDELVLDARKLAAAPALLRPREEPRTYLVRRDLARALQAAGPRNLHLTELGILHG